MSDELKEALQLLEQAVDHDEHVANVRITITLKKQKQGKVKDENKS